MSKEPFENPQLLELATWEALIKSEEWGVYKKLCEDHKEYLTRECLMYIRKADFHNAVRAEAKVEDVDKKLVLITKRMTELRREGAKDEAGRD